MIEKKSMPYNTYADNPLFIQFCSVTQIII